MKLRDFFTIREAADRLGFDYLRIYDLTESGQLPCTFFGRATRAIHRSDVAALEASLTSRDIKESKKRQVKKNNLGNLMKPGEYYTLEQAAKRVNVSKNTVIDALKAGLIEEEHFGGAIAIHESQLEQFPQIRTELTIVDKRRARQELAAAGFVYSRNPPPGAPRGSSRNPSPFRRGWSKDGVYYGLTALEALRAWQQSSKQRKS